MNSLLLSTAFVFSQGQEPAEPIDKGEAKPSRTTAPEPLKIFTTTSTHIDRYLEMAIGYMEKLPEQDRVYFRFLAFNSTPDVLLPERKTLGELYYNTTNTANTLARFFDVIQDRSQRLIAIDLRRTRLTVEAWTATVRTDQKFRESHADHTLAERLRLLAGVQQDPETLHVDVIAPGEWLIRELMEPGNRLSNALYNFTYPEERFGKTQFAYSKQTAPITAVATRKVKKIIEVDWQGGPYPDPTTGKPMPYRDPRTGREHDNWPAGSFKVKKEVEVDEPTGLVNVETARFTVVGQQKVGTKILKDFPENLEQFQERHGITDAQRTLDKERIFAKRGEVVGGSRNVKNGSIVAYNDRTIEILVLAGGFPSLRTRDFKRTANASNPANDPAGVVVGDLQEDAGEHLVTLPCGLQTAFLTGGAKEGRKRVEAGDAEVVHSSKDPSFGVVKTQYSCVICHGPSHGVLDPSNRKIADGLRRGIRLLDKDPFRADAVTAFLIGWEEDTEYWRLPYKKALRTLTTTRDNVGWSGQRYADETIRFRDWYDAPVTLELAAAEMGIPRLALMFVLMTEGGIDSQNLFLGEAIPRAEWDENLYRKLAVTFAAMRNEETPNPLLSWLYPNLLRKTTKGK